MLVKKHRGGGADVTAHSGGAVDGGGGALVGRQAAMARICQLRLGVVGAAEGEPAVHVHAGAAGVGVRGVGGGVLWFVVVEAAGGGHAVHVHAGAARVGGRDVGGGGLFLCHCRE